MLRKRECDLKGRSIIQLRLYIKINLIIIILLIVLKDWLLLLEITCIGTCIARVWHVHPTISDSSSELSALYIMIIYIIYILLI